jgi:hypothetical protein
MYSCFSTCDFCNKKSHLSHKYRYLWEILPEHMHPINLLRNQIPQLPLIFGRILYDGERAIAMLLSCEMYILHSIVS